MQDLAVSLHDIALLQTVPAAIAGDQPERERLVELARRLDPETVQLDYQIAVQGRDDLSIAPDEFAGFSMTLLRMLAFAPGGLQPAAAGQMKPDAVAASRRRPAAVLSAPDTNAPLPAVKAEQDSMGDSEPAPSAPEVPAGGLKAPDPEIIAAADRAISDWPGWIAQCKLNGLAHQLAYNAELKAHRQTPAGIDIELLLTETNRHLAERAYQDKLREALSGALGAPVRLKIEIGGAGEGSMAAQERRARQILQDNAAASFNDDPFVRDAVRLFDARVRPQSIQPVTLRQGNKS